jgi:hypothetical protein
MFRDMGVEGAITRFPRMNNVNKSLSCAIVRQNYRGRWAGLGPEPSFLSLDDAAEMKRRARVSDLLNKRFAGTNQSLFAVLAEAKAKAPAEVPERMRA